MNKICTSIEQSKKLLELGIDVNTADMYWSKCTIIDFGDGTLKVAYTAEPCNISQFKNTDEDIPAWSLTSLLDILPNNEVTSTTVTRGGWNIEPAKYLDIWFAEYETEKHDNDFSLSANNPIDAVFEMVCWLKENGKI